MYKYTHIALSTSSGKESSVYGNQNCLKFWLFFLLSSDDWIRKLWYIYTMQYYSAIRKNAFESVLMRWMKLEPIIQSEVKSETKTPMQYINAYIWNLERW